MVEKWRLVREGITGGYVLGTWRSSGTARTSCSRWGMPWELERGQRLGICAAVVETESVRQPVLRLGRRSCEIEPFDGVVGGWANCGAEHLWVIARVGWICDYGGLQPVVVGLFSIRLETETGG